MNVFFIIYNLFVFSHSSYEQQSDLLFEPYLRVQDIIFVSKSLPKLKRLSNNPQPILYPQANNPTNI